MWLREGRGTTGGKLSASWEGKGERREKKKKSRKKRGRDINENVQTRRPRKKR